MLLGIKLPWRTVQTYLFDLCLIAWSVEFVKASNEHINHAAGLMDPVGQFFREKRNLRTKKQWFCVNTEGDLLRFGSQKGAVARLRFHQRDE